MVFGLLTGLAFEEAGNGGCFSLVPHVHSTSNGKQIDTILSLKIIATIADCCVGLITVVTGAAGDLAYCFCSLPVTTVRITARYFG